MKNFSNYINKTFITKMIKSHDLGILGNAIDKELISELKTINPEYLSNLKCSDDAKAFIDEFLTDVKSDECSNYATEFKLIHNF